MFKRMKNKKALSQILAISIFIILVFVSLAIILSSIKQIPEKLAPEFSCFELQTQISKPLTIKKACYNSQDVELTLTRSPNSIKINTIDFSISFDNKDTLNYYCGANCENAIILKEGDTITYFFDVGEGANPKGLALGINGCTILSEEIAQKCSS